MQEMIRFALLGLGIGALYALASQGLIVIYRGSGILNFAHGAIGMTGAYVEWELRTRSHWAFIPALLAGVAFSAAVGALTHLLIMRQLRRASPLVRVIATLGVLATLQAVAILRYGPAPKFVNSELPTHVLHLSGSIVISTDRIILIGIAAVISAALWAFYRYSRFGVVTSAVSENQRAAAALGWSPDAIAVANWALGSALAGLAAILIAPIVTLQPTVMTNLILAATAAALVASFRSFPVAFLAGLAMGIAETEVNLYVTQTGLGKSIPFIVIVLWLMLRGQALPLRDYFLQRLPSVGSGRINWRWLAVGVAIAAVLLLTTSPAWVDAVTITLGVALVLLSVVVVTGYAGQLSLAQYAIGGFGAWVAGRLIAVHHLSFLAAAAIGILATVPLGMAFALPAVRTRGINLAVVTLGLGSAIELLLFDNPGYTGGINGTQVGKPTLFGWDVNAISHPARYGFLVLACFVLAALAVSNVRRGRSGRRLIAARTNERAAAALGISVPAAKLYAFALSAAIAALGGILLAFQLPTIDYTSFTNFTSLIFVGFALIGGLGYLMGPVVGATLAAGALGQQVLNSVFPGVGKYIPLIGGLMILALVLLNQDGVARETIGQLRWVSSKLGGSARRPARAHLRAPGPARAPVAVRVVPTTLQVRDLTVRYGGTVALDGVSLSAQPGRVTGLIGPNGAGKTTLIDAVTGFTRAEGDLRLNDVDIMGWSPVRRARHGLGRSFQSLELFEDSTVLDNLRTAADQHDWLSYLRDLVHPVNPPLPAELAAASCEFGLELELERTVASLSYGQRRLLAIARAVATQPSVLLLDEPAAGLGDAETAELATLVRRLADDWGMAILLVEHDMSFVMSVCDEIVVLDFGRKISQGSPVQVRNDPAVLAAYLGSDAQAGEATDAHHAQSGTPTPRSAGNR